MESLKPPGKRSADLLFAACALLLIFIMAARTPVDGDLWWHLRAGEDAWTSGHPVLVDAYSYTRSGVAWINHSWLAQVILYLCYHLFNYWGLAFFMALAATLSMLLVYLQLEGPAWLKAFLLLLGGTVAAVVWTPRPQVLSLVMLAGVGFLLHLYKWQGRNRLWVFPLLFMLWSNLHGGYPLGLLLIGITILGEVANHLLGFGNDPFVLSWKHIGWLALWGIAGGLAVVINPNGLNMWRIPFQTVEVAALQQRISEWASPDFHAAFQQPFLVLLFATLAALGFSGRRADGSDVLAVCFFGWMALLARRNFGPFALVCLPVLARHAAGSLAAWSVRLDLSSRLKKLDLWLKGRRKHPPPSIHPVTRKILNLTIVALLGFAACAKLYAVAHPAMVASHLESAYPVQAMQWIERNHPPGRMMSEYHWGGYLIWQAREYPVFVDGRTDLFGDEIINQWLGVIQAGDAFNQILDDWNIRLLLVEPGRPVIPLVLDSGWQLLYRDNVCILLGR